MGCGTSKGANAAIAAFGPSNKRNRPASAPIKAKKASSAGRDVRPQSGRVSVSAVIAFRGESPASGHSVDSGIGGDSRDGSANLARAMMPAKQNDILQVNNQPRLRVDESSILASLRQEGLLGAPNTNTSKGGLCFEVSAEELKVRSRRPPPRLQRLEKITPSDAARSENIRQKLASAEIRRRKREKERIQRSREKDAKNLDVNLASLDTEKRSDESIEIPKAPQGRIVSAKHRRRPPPDPTLPPATAQVDAVTSKGSPLIIDQVLVDSGFS